MSPQVVPTCALSFQLWNNVVFFLHLYMQINPKVYCVPGQDSLAARQVMEFNLSETQFPSLKMREVDKMISKISSVILVMLERLMY